MSSINTNISAMTALQSLTAANKAYTETQKHIATGLRVGEASDNAAYWSIATTMRSDRSALSTVQDALGLGGSMVDVAYTAVNTSIDLVDQIKTKLVAAREPGIDRTKVQSEISELQKQLAGIASSASFSGDNWLSVDSSVSTYNASKNIVASFVRTGSTVSVQTITIDTAGMDLFDANTAATNAAAGILDANRTTLGVARQHGDDLLGLGPLHLGPDGQLHRSRHPRQLHQGCGRGHQGDDHGRRQPRRRQEAHRPAEGLRHQPDQRPRSRHRLARRCRYERGIRPSCRPCRSSSSWASRH